MTEDDLLACKLNREEEVAINSRQIETLMNSLENYNANLKDMCAKRIDELMHSSRTSNAYLQPHWEKRDSYKIDVDDKNRALVSLLQRGHDAIQIASEKDAKSFDSKKITKKK